MGMWQVAQLYNPANYHELGRIWKTYTSMLAGIHTKYNVGNHGNDMVLVCCMFGTMCCFWIPFAIYASNTHKKALEQAIKLDAELKMCFQQFNDELRNSGF